MKRGDSAAWRALLSGELARFEAQLAQFADPTRPAPREIAALDRAIAQARPEAESTEELRRLRVVLLEAADVAKRAERKFGAGAAFRATRALVEQASSARVADYKAARLARAGVVAVIDACCGAGGDTRAFAARFGAASVLAVDRDPLAALFARVNAGCEVLVSELDACLDDVRAQRVGAAGPLCLHLDPARRDGDGGRGAALRELEPSFARCLASVGRQLASRPEDVAMIKLSPAADFDEVAARIRDASGRELPSALPWELEWVAEEHGLVQAIVCIGARLVASARAGHGNGHGHGQGRGNEARALRRATRLAPDFESSIADARADAGGAMFEESRHRGEVAELVEPGDFLLRPDPVLERARLFRACVAGRDAGADAVEIRELHPGLGLYCAASSARFEAAGERAPWRNEAHRVVASMPWRARAVKQFLKARGAVIVELRTRGAAADVERARVGLPLDASRRGSPGAYVLWILRFSKRRVAILTESTSERWTLVGLAS